jgi:hypothetical protein
MTYYISSKDQRLIFVDDVTGEIEEFQKAGEQKKVAASGELSTKIVKKEKHKTKDAKIKKEKPEKETRTCSHCGRPGHFAKTCPGLVNKPMQGFNVGGPEEVVAGDEAFEVTQNVKIDVQEMLEQGMGSAEIAQHYEIPQRVANRVIAEVKGIKLL